MSYYLRIRGEISGPYTAEEIRRMLDREVVSRVHEISSDRRKWRPLGTAGDFLQAPAAGESASSPPDDPAPDEPMTLEDLVAAPEGAMPAPALATPSAAAFALPVEVSVGILLIFATLVPLSREKGLPRFFWDQGILIQIAFGVMLLLAVASILTAWSIGERDRPLAHTVLGAAGLLALLALLSRGGAVAWIAGIQCFAAVAAATLPTVLPSPATPRNAMFPLPMAGLAFAAASVVSLGIGLAAWSLQPTAPAARFELVNAARVVLLSAGFGVLLLQGLEPRRVKRPTFAGISPARTTRTQADLTEARS